MVWQTCPTGGAMKGTGGEFPHHVVCYKIPGSPDLSDRSDREFTPPSEFEVLLRPW